MVERLPIDDFLEACERERRLDPKTIRAYQCDLEQYRVWIATQETDPLSREAARAYLAYLNERYAPATVKRKIESLRALLSWAADRGAIIRNPFEGFKVRVCEPKRLPRTIPLADLKLLFEHLYRAELSPSSSFAPVRDRAIVEILIATGLRVSELCALDVASVDMVGKSVRVLGKGDKERSVQLENGHTLAALGRYLDLRGREAGANEERALFLNRWGGQDLGPLRTGDARSTRS